MSQNWEVLLFAFFVLLKYSGFSCNEYNCWFLFQKLTGSRKLSNEIVNEELWFFDLEKNEFNYQWTFFLAEIFGNFGQWRFPYEFNRKLFKENSLQVEPCANCDFERRSQKVIRVEKNSWKLKFLETNGSSVRVQHVKFSCSQASKTKQYYKGAFFK